VSFDGVEDVRIKKVRDQCQSVDHGSQRTLFHFNFTLSVENENEKIVYCI